jgi:hypothetical protein
MKLKLEARSLELESERAELENKRVELENRRISAELRKKEIELEKEEQNLMADAMGGIQTKDLALSDISEGDGERGNKSVASNVRAKSSKGMIKKCMEDLFDNALVTNDVGTETMIIVIVGCGNH